MVDIPFVFIHQIIKFDSLSGVHASSKLSKIKIKLIGFKSVFFHALKAVIDFLIFFFARLVQFFQILFSRNSPFLVLWVAFFSRHLDKNLLGRALHNLFNLLGYQKSLLNRSFHERRNIEIFYDFV